MPFVKPHSYYSSAKDFLGKAYMTGRHFISQVDGAAQRTFSVLKAIQPIVAEAANIYGCAQTKAMLNQASRNVNAASKVHQQLRGEAARASGLFNRMAVASGY